METSTISLAETLAARGVPAELTLPLDATITPAMLGARPDRSASTLPRVSLSLPGQTGRPSMPPEGRELEVISQLGEGGMGVVYLARQRSLDREVAIKTTRHAESADASGALCAEAVVTGHLEHPGIVPVHQLAQAPDGRPVLVMKRVEGTSWRALLADPAHAAWATLRIEESDRERFHLEVLRRVCDALAFAHSRGIVHRDLKPENVMIGAYGEVYLVDWGIATRAGTVGGDVLVGTPLYMAPEMVGGRPVDARTDVFLVGATLHEVLTGSPPHTGQTIHQVLFHAIAASPPVYGPEVDPELAAIATRAMARDPGDRHADAREIADALRDHARHRASRALSQSADAKRAELAARVARPIADADIPALYALLAECRFGYDEARREWPGNDAVPRGLRACREHAVAIEIARRDPSAARAELEAMGDPARALVESVAELERALERERAEDARVRALAETADSSASPGSRVLAGITGAIAAAVISISIYVRTHTGELTTSDALMFSVITLAVMAAVLATFGRSLWSHPFNRRIAVWSITGVAMLVVDRVVGVIAGTPVATLMVHDLVLLAATFAAAAVFSFRVLTIGAVICVAAALIGALVPESITATFGIASVLAIATIPLAAARARRAKP